MKRLGLIGGPGVELATHYARQIEDEVEHRLGHEQPADLLTFCLPTPEVRALAAAGDWAALGRLLTQAAASLRGFGAEEMLLASPILEMAASTADEELDFLSPFEATAAALNSGRLRRVGLLGTSWPGEELRWRRELNAAGVHDVLLPVPRDRHHISSLLYERLELGLLDETDRADIIRIVSSLRQAGARAVVVCAPALTAVIEEAPPILATFDVAELHAVAAVEWALGAAVIA